MFAWSHAGAYGFYKESKMISDVVHFLRCVCNVVDILCCTRLCLHGRAGASAGARLMTTTKYMCEVLPLLTMLARNLLQIMIRNVLYKALSATKLHALALYRPMPD